MTSARRIRLLALSPIPEEGAGCRFRIGQFIPLSRIGRLRRHARFPVHSRVLPSGLQAWKLFAQGGHLCRSVAEAARCAPRSLAFRCRPPLRELFPLGPALIERMLTHGRAADRLRFRRCDFSAQRQRREPADRRPEAAAESRVDHPRSDHVIAGNEYLATYARRFNDAVTVIPTWVDTGGSPRPLASAAAHPTNCRVLGWIGSPTTAHLHQRAWPRCFAAFASGIRSSCA